ncbi:ABC transporter permease [Texcoconibacillus texcoconensis]|uniref:Tungstate transport system permease protein n=1 Tax=Texcoconibacillus texcoconensis TaxID=1095777 RepID=A0A840QPF3_9BACI|nr:ABC transporter permease [Texcoconibacillus texcoconensis]MBB5173282.1 tungstate transport system permease protein [Texcoconibacillus texcoconensis]
MELIVSGLSEAFRMIIELDRDIFDITWLTLRVCILATLISMIIGIPLGMLLALKHFIGRRFLIVLAQAGMGLPPVVAGLWVTIFLWRSGPLGSIQWLFTPTAIVIAQVVVSLPIIISLTYAALQRLDPQLKKQLKALGPTRLQYGWFLLREARFGIVAAVMAGLGRVLAEVGAAQMVGGNLLGDTRILTTAMVMEVSRGNFDVAFALSFILMTIAFLITFLLTYFQQRQVIR